MNFLSALITPQTAATAAFVLVIGITILGAIIAVGARNIFHNVLGLCLSLFGVAGIFVFLNSPFVALMEILIYVGAICIAICFAIMLSEPLYLPRPPRNKVKVFGAAVGAGGDLCLPGPVAEENHLDPGGGTEHRLVHYHHRPLPAHQLRLNL